MIDADQATLLDGPGAIVSHAEVLAVAHLSVADAARELGVSQSTIRRCRKNLATLES